MKKLMFGRPISTLLPRHGDVSCDDHVNWLEAEKCKMKQHHDRSSRPDDLPPMYKGQQVRILDKVRK